MVRRKPGIPFCRAEHVRRRLWLPARSDLVKTFSWMPDLLRKLEKHNGHSYFLVLRIFPEGQEIPMYLVSDKLKADPPVAVIGFLSIPTAFAEGRAFYKGQAARKYHWCWRRERDWLFRSVPLRINQFLRQLLLLNSYIWARPMFVVVSHTKHMDFIASEKETWMQT